MAFAFKGSLACGQALFSRLRIIPVIGLLLGTAGLANASPVLFFSDLDSAPVNAYVTVWGKNFGTSAGTIKVGSASVSGSAILSWTASKVEFKIPATSGLSGLTVVDSSGSASNAIAFTSRSTGKLYFISQSKGSNSYTGLSESVSGSSGPWKDMTMVGTKLSAGDVAYVMSGSYTGSDNPTWGTMILVETSGSSGNPIAVVGYPGQTPTVGVASNRRAVYFDNQSYWTIAKLNLMGGQTIVEGGGPHIRVIGNSATGVVSNAGVYAFTEGSNNLRFLGNSCTNCGQSGSKYTHAFYYGGFGAGTDVEFGWNIAKNELGGRGIQVYGHTSSDSLTGLSIHDNYVDGADYDCILVGSSDASPTDWVKDALIYNNVAHNCGRADGGAGLRLGNSGAAFQVYQNTLVSSTRSIYFEMSKSAIVKNNIFDGPILVNSTANSLTLSNNGYVGATAPSVESKSIVASDPDFNNASSGDYSLQSGSPFKGKGVQLSLGVVSIALTANPDLGSLMWANQTTSTTPLPLPPTITSIQ